MKLMSQRQTINIFVIKNLMKTIFVIGSKKHTLKYTRKMPEGEVKKMKSFVTNKGQKLEKTSKFKILKVSDDKTSRTFKISL